MMGSCWGVLACRMWTISSKPERSECFTSPIEMCDKERGEDHYCRDGCAMRLAISLRCSRESYVKLLEDPEKNTVFPVLEVCPDDVALPKRESETVVWSRKLFACGWDGWQTRN